MMISQLVNFFNGQKWPRIPLKVIKPEIVYTIPALKTWLERSMATIHYIQCSIETSTVETPLEVPP